MPVLLAAAVLASSCGEGYGDTVSIDASRLASQPSKQAKPGAGLAERIDARNVPESERASQAPVAPPQLVYDLPAGWEALPPTEFRQINLRFLEDPRGELSLTFLQQDAGGLDKNVNRWRGQVGQPPMGPGEIAALPKRTVFGQPATYVEFFGPYQGMGGPRIEDGGLAGAILSKGGGTLFIKMTGPREVIQSQRDALSGFLDTLRLAPAAAGAGSGAATSDAAGAASPVAWDAPSGWTEEAGSQFREITFRKGAVQMYVSLARGGALPNLNRWANQLGMPPFDAKSMDTLPRTPMMDGEGYVFEGVGALKGMRDPAPVPDQRVLGALIERGGLIVTLKATGPNMDVDAAREDFFALARSLRRADAPR